MPVRTYVARIAASLALVAATAAATPVGVSTATAAAYDVASCTSNSNALAPISGADDAWTPDLTSDFTHLEFVTHCPPASGVDLDGMRVETKLNGGGPLQGAYAQWRFDAPAGTTVTRVRLWREIGKRANTWELYTRATDGARLGGTDGTSINDSDCVKDPSNFTCQIGSPGGAAADWTALSTTGVVVGIRCAATSCATGATLHDAWTAIYGAIVTVDDPTAPTATGAGGNLLTDSYVRGNATATLDSATDVTGIKALHVKENGTVLAETQRSCDYSRRVPCANLTAPGSVTVATTGMADGRHTIQVGASDAAGNFAPATTQDVIVDNHAPAAPTPTSPATQTVGGPSATVAWQAPTGQVAPIAAAHVTVCSPSSVCRSTTQSAGPADGSATVSLTGGYGVYSVYVSLEDAAGNTDPNRLAGYQVVFPDPDPAPAQSPTTILLPAPLPAPAATPTPTPTPKPQPRKSARLALQRPAVARDRRTIAVEGSVAPGVTGRVTASAKATIRGRTRTVTKRVAIRDRRYSVRLRLPSTVWRTATVTVRFAGDARHTAARLTRRVTQRRPRA
jgi:hypothetical protein